MPTFEYRFINPSSGRKNKKTIRAFDEDELRAILDGKGIEPVEVIVLPEPEATERQIDYLRDLTGSAPHGLTLKEASNLIDNALGKRTTADPADFDIAKNLKIEVTQYASKKAIHEAIFYEMQSRGLPAFAAWFTYRVYRDEFDRRDDGIRDPLDPAFIEIGQSIVDDVRLTASFKRIASRSSVHFRWFGLLRTPDGMEMHGDGDKSEVYKFVVDELKRRGFLTERRVAPSFNRQRNGRFTEGTAELPSNWSYPPKRKIPLWMWGLAVLVFIAWTAT